MKLKKIFLAIAAAICCLSIAGCKNNTDQFIDYVHDGSVSLDLSYSGKSFWTDGIEQVTVKTTIDGDTVHFNTPSDTTKILKARFYGIDTPESTGQIQPFGKQASNFTKEKILKANSSGTIVVSSPRHDYGIPSPDSTGERYVSLVWINETKKNAPKNELVLLNLYIVQEGFSWVKNTNDFPEYSNTFISASQQAEKFKKGLFSDEPDPLYNYGGYEDCSLIEIKREIIECLKDKNHVNKFDNAKLRVTGSIVGVTSDNTMYIQDFYSHEDYPDLVGEEGEYAGLNIYMGASGGFPNDFYTPGNYIQVCGTCVDSEEFGFQMSGCKFPILPFDETDAQVIYYKDSSALDPEKQLKEFEYSISEINNLIDKKDYDKINCAMSCTTELTCTSAYTPSQSSTGTKKFTLSFANTKLKAYITFKYIPYADHKGTTFSTAEQFVGKTFLLRGAFVPHITTSGNITIQINPINSSYLICTTPYSE